MLSPEYLESIPKVMVKRMEHLETFIIKEIARRIATSEGQVVTQSALHQYEIAEGLGMSLERIQDEVAKLTEKSKTEINDLLEDAAKEALKYGNTILEKTGETTQNINTFPALSELLEAVKQQTEDTFTNITGTLGFTVKIDNKTVFQEISKFFQTTVEDAALEVATGAADYTSAITRAIRTMATSGLKTVNYASGWVDKADVATRRAIMTGISQISGHISEHTAKLLGTDLMEITAHGGARPSHAEWQGQIVDRTGRDRRYLSPDDIGFGRVDGFKGANCRHDWFPFVEGVSERVYTDEELKNIDPPPFEFEGKEYTAYKATQQQRKLERAIRATKNNLVGLEASINECSKQGGKSQVDIKKLQDDFITNSVLLQAQRNKYREFSEKAKMPLQKDRIQIPGFNRDMADKTKITN